VRVRGSSHIEGTAVAFANGVEVTGRVTDDTGRPVANARVLVRLAGNQPDRLPRAEACRGQAPIAAAPAEGAAAALSGSDGRFCLHFSEQLGSGRLTLRFQDEREWLDASELELELQNAPASELAFVPPPRSLAVDDSEASVVVQARSRAPAAQDIELSWVRDGHSQVLARGKLQPNEALRLAFSPKAMGEPGHGELVAAVAGAGAAGAARAIVPLVGRVTLSAPTQIRTDAQGRATLVVSAQAGAFVVRSGSVEALQDARTVGIAPVSSGRAELPISLEARVGSTHVTLRYLGSAPYWVPGTELAVEVEVPPPSPWQRLPWIVALIAVAGWILTAWRRPRHQELPTTRPRLGQVGTPTLQWSAGTTGTSWQGLVTDAHDGRPLPGASITVVWSHGATISALSNENGEFELTPHQPRLAEAEIRVDAPLHAALTGRLPPPGRLHVSLVTRRRELLASALAWWRGRGLARAASEPTPAEMAEEVAVAAGSARADVSAWLGALEAAAYGPAPVDAETEERVRNLEPYEHAGENQPEIPATRPRRG